MRLTLKAVNTETDRRGHTAQLEKGDGYFYFQSGEAADWLDRTVNMPTLSSLTMEQWLAEFDRFRKAERYDHGKRRQACAKTEADKGQPVRCAVEEECQQASNHHHAILPHVVCVICDDLVEGSGCRETRGVGYWHMPCDTTPWP